jgi:hypothetical protein
MFCGMVASCDCSLLRATRCAFIRAAAHLARLALQLLEELAIHDLADVLFALGLVNLDPFFLALNRAL